MTATGIVTASITKEAVEELGLAAGTLTTVLVKSTEVMLAVGNTDGGAGRG